MTAVVLELGTCLGITTAYLGKHAASVTTIEGNPALAGHAEDIWRAPQRSECDQHRR